MGLSWRRLNSLPSFTRARMVSAPPPMFIVTLGCTTCPHCGTLGWSSAYTKLLEKLSREEPGLQDLKKLLGLVLCTWDSEK